MDITQEGHVGHFLEHGQIEMSAFDEWACLSNVDGLHPISGDRVKHVDMSIRIHQKTSITNGNVDGNGWVHDLPIPGFSTLHVHINAQSVKDQEKLSVSQFDGSQSIHRVVGQKAKHLIVRMD